MVATAASNMPSSKEVSEGLDSVDPETPVRPQRSSRSPSPKYYQNDPSEITLSVTSLPPYPLDDSGFESPTKPYRVHEPKSYQHQITHSNFDHGVDDGLRMPPPPPKKVTHSLNEEFLAVATLCLASAFAFFCCPIFVERPEQ